MGPPGVLAGAAVGPWAVRRRAGQLELGAVAASQTTQHQAGRVAVAGGSVRLASAAVAAARAAKPQLLPQGSPRCTP